jgi:hypothetical protein
MTNPETSTGPESADRPKTANIPVVAGRDLAPVYTNFALVSGTPHELILDFALNAPAQGGQQQVVQINDRVVMNYQAGKRLWVALGAALQHFEKTFGPIEPDAAKRQPSGSPS